MKTFKQFINESNNNYELIIKKGHKLFHASGEKFTLPLKVGGYDKILWTTEQSGISQTYIPVSKSTIYINTNFLTEPIYNESERNIQKQLGINYDYSNVKWYDQYTSSYKVPDIFKDLYEENQKKLDELNNFTNKYDDLKKEYEQTKKNRYSRKIVSNAKTIRNTTTKLLRSKITTRKK